MSKTTVNYFYGTPCRTCFRLKTLNFVCFVSQCRHVREGVALLGLVRKVLVMFGATASHLLDPSALERAVEVSRDELPVIAVPITVVLIKQPSQIQNYRHIYHT